MKNFKINAITALVVGLNVATAHAARTTNPEPNQNVLYSGGSVFLNHADATNVDEPSHTAIGQSNLIYSVPESNDPTEDQGSSSAFGNQNTIKGQHANAFGDGNDAYGKQTQSFGDGNKVYANESIGYGIKNQIGTQPSDAKSPKATREADTNTNSASVFGLNNTVVGNNILTLGKENKITDTSTTNATVIGFNSTANATNAIVIGTESQASANETIAIGQKAKASGQNSNAFGSQANALGTSSLAVGTGAQAKQDSAVAIGNDSNATAKSSVALGESTNATAIFATAVGDSATASGVRSFAAGLNSNAQSDDSIAIGANTSSTVRGISIGAEASAYHQGISVGYKSNASGIGSIATGVETSASGLSSIASGSNAVASSTGSVAIGEQSKATAGYGLAIGAKAKAEHSSSVALGNGSETKQAKSVKNATVNNLSYGNFAGTDATATVSVGATQNAQYTRQIVNVGAGEISKTSTDAINGSQLYSVTDTVGNIANSMKNIIGGNAAINSNGTINATNIGNTGKNTIHEAIESIKQSAQNGKDVEVTAGDNIVIEKTTSTTNPQKTFKVSTSKNLKADSYSVNNSNIKIDKNGINAGNKNITNVAEGTNATDAVNVSQLNKVKSSITNNTQAISNNTRAINNLNKKVNDVDRKSRAGIAGVAAIASAPSARKDGKSMISTGVAHHRGESAIAIKASRNSDNGHWSSNVNGAADTRGQWTVGAGVGYEW